MASVLTTSLSGMLANQQMLDVTSNNIANADTNGFKSSRTDFADQLYHLDIGPTQASGAVGGRDPAQTGQGVLVQAVSVQWTQGGVNATGRNLDLAINGNGFFRLRDANGTEHYSRVGNFGFDGGIPRRLVDLGTGMEVLNSQGQTISPVDAIAPQATTRIDLTGNLPPDTANPLHGSTLKSLFPLHAANGTLAQVSTRLRDTTLVQNPPTAPVAINLYGTAPDGVPFSTSVSIQPNATVQDLVTALNAALVRPSTTGAGTEQIASIGFDSASLVATGAMPGKGFSLFIGEQPAPPQPAANDTANNWQYGSTTDAFAWSRMRFTPQTVDSTFHLYTGDGSLHEVTGRWYNASTVTTGSGTLTDNQRIWDFIADTPTAGSLAPGGDRLRGLTFNSDGSLLTAPTGSLVSTWVSGGASTVTFNPVAINGFNSDGLMDATDNTGYAAGSLQTISVDGDGVVTGGYSNGRTVPMSAAGHQIGLAVFANNGGLIAEGGSLWQGSVNSGPVQYVTGGLNGTNTITSGSLEGSNVDVANEFVRLVTAQRGFQANSRAFQTGDQLLTEAFGLFR